MGKTILELFQTKKLTGTQTAQQKYETRNSKDIPISTPNGVLNATSFALVNKLRRSNISDRTKETVIEEELLGLRQLRFLSQPIIYGTDIIRLNRLSTNMLDDIFILYFRFIQTQYGKNSVEAILLTYNLNNHGLQYKT